MLRCRTFKGSSVVVATTIPTSGRRAFAASFAFRSFRSFSSFASVRGVRCFSFAFHRSVPRTVCFTFARSLTFGAISGIVPRHVAVVTDWPFSFPILTAMTAPSSAGVFQSSSASSQPQSSSYAACAPSSRCWQAETSILSEVRFDEN